MMRTPQQRSEKQDFRLGQILGVFIAVYMACVLTLHTTHLIDSQLLSLRPWFWSAAATMIWGMGVALWLSVKRRRKHVFPARIWFFMLLFWAIYAPLLRLLVPPIQPFSSRDLILGTSILITFMNVFSIPSHRRAFVTMSILSVFMHMSASWLSNDPPFFILMIFFSGLLGFGFSVLRRYMNRTYARLWDQAQNRHSKNSGTQRQIDRVDLLKSHTEHHIQNMDIDEWQQQIFLYQNVASWSVTANSIQEQESLRERLALHVDQAQNAIDRLKSTQQKIHLALLASRAGTSHEKDAEPLAERALSSHPWGDRT